MSKLARLAEQPFHKVQPSHREAAADTQCTACHTLAPVAQTGHALDEAVSRFGLEQHHKTLLALYNWFHPGHL